MNLTKKEVENLIDKKLSSREFDKDVKKIVADVMVELFKVLWQKKNNWISDVKK